MTQPRLWLQYLLISVTSPPNENDQRFYVFDETVMYVYTFKPEDLVKIDTDSPTCGTPSTYKERLGKKIDATCRTCRPSGIVFIDTQNKNPA